MGTARKRPLERPTGPFKGDPEVRKKKKGKKSKEKKDGSTTIEPINKTTIETSTATAEGKMMAQVVSTFSRSEQSRFEAFRRAALPADSISKYVAQCLIDEYGELSRAPILSEMCAHGQAEEITIVVSTLAKAYAQRLVTASRQLMGSSSEPIKPEFIITAFQDRQSRGLDPGFFLQPASTTVKTVLKDASYERKRLVALKAQEDYDKLYPSAVETEDDQAHLSNDSMEVL